MPEQLRVALWNWMRAQNKGVPRRDLLDAEADLREILAQVFPGNRPGNKAQ